jgi:hypothetical protein
VRPHGGDVVRCGNAELQSAAAAVVDAARQLERVGAPAGLMLLSGITVDIPVGLIQMGSLILSAGVGLGFIPILSGGLAVAARSVLLSSPSTDPRIVAFQEQGPAGLLALYQRLTGAAQTDAYSEAFLVVGLICLAGVVLAAFLPSGRPTSGSSTGAH